MTIKLLKIKEVADLLRTPIPTVRKWAQDGKLPAAKIGKSWLIDADKLQALLEGKKIEIRE